MRRSTVAAALVLAVIASVGALALPELMGLLGQVEGETSGVSPAVAEGAGRVRVFIFVVIGILFLAVFTAAANKE